MLTANLWGRSTCWALSQMLRNAQCSERPKRKVKPRQLCDVGREKEGSFLSSSLTLGGKQDRRPESKDEAPLAPVLVPRAGVIMDRTGAEILHPGKS